MSLLRGRLTEAAAKADGGYPDNDELFIDPDTGVPKLKPRRAKAPRKSAERLEQAIKERMPERSLLGIVARTAYWIEWWHRFGPASGNDPKLKDPFGRYVITTFVKGTNMTFAEAARHIAAVSAHELSVAARRHTTTAKLNEALTDVVNAHAKLDMSRAWGNATTAAADDTHMDTYLDNLLAETSVRYGAVGGIAYHHISDLYIGLFTHFVPLGDRPAGPRPDLAVPDRAHQPLRRVLHPRDRHHPGALRHPPRHRLHHAGRRAGSGRVNHLAARHTQVTGSAVRPEPADRVRAGAGTAPGTHGPWAAGGPGGAPRRRAAPGPSAYALTRGQVTAMTQVRAKWVPMCASWRCPPMARSPSTPMTTWMWAKPLRISPVPGHLAGQVVLGDGVLERVAFGHGRDGEGVGGPDQGDDRRVGDAGLGGLAVQLVDELTGGDFKDDHAGLRPITGLSSRSMTEEHQRAPESRGLRASLAKRVARKSVWWPYAVARKAIRPAVVQSTAQTREVTAVI
ncbi:MULTISPECIES: Tn3 family transposase [Streptomyces]|uniref:Tn3 family transposase n=1 Tax=Streptomyces TaxID=1883 RepID=UPI000A53897F|nr:MULTISPECIES: Tn3 family transposase [Streptomyces]